MIINKTCFFQVPKILRSRMTFSFRVLCHELKVWKIQYKSYNYTPPYPLYLWLLVALTNSITYKWFMQDTSSFDDKVPERSTNSLLEPDMPNSHLWIPTCHPAMFTFYMWNLIIIMYSENVCVANLNIFGTNVLLLMYCPDVVFFAHKPSMLTLSTLAKANKP